MSFAQEMKDFLGAWQGTTKMFDDHAYKQVLTKYQKTLTDKTQQDMNDPLKDEQAKANVALTKARIGAVGASNSLTALRRQELQARIDAIKQGAQPQEDPVAASISAPPAVSAKTAIPAAPEDDSTPVQKFAAGGMVQPAVGDEEDPDEADDDGSDAPTDVSARARAPYSMQAAHDAVKGGLQYGMQAMGLNQSAAVPTPQRQQAVRAFTRGAGAAPLADMQQIYRKVDPNGQMSDSERNMAALSAVYQFKLRQGDPQGAQRAAFMMLQHYRMASQRYAAIAAAAAEQGNMDAAAKAAMKAYANIPDGKDLKIGKGQNGQLQFSYTDADGKQIAGGLATPQQLAAAAMGVATKGFDQFLLQAAGERAPKQAVSEAAPRAPRPADREKAIGAVDTSLDAQFPSEGDKPAVGPEERRLLQGTAYRILNNPKNSRLTPDEAVDVAKRLLSPNAKNPDEEGFTAKKLDDDQGYEVRIGKGVPLHLPNDEFDAIAAVRAEKLARIRKQREDAEKKSKEPGVISELGKAYERFMSKKGSEGEARPKSDIPPSLDIVSPVLDWMSDVRDKINAIPTKDSPPEVNYGD